jgi:DNA-binding MarR family transcriptional regulator
VNIEELAQKHALDFPGYKLADFYEAAFPSYAIQLQVLMQVKRPLPVLEEFILKTADSGMTKISEIAGVLGLEHAAVEGGFDQLQKRDYIYFNASQESSKNISVLITNKGRNVLKELFITEPQPSNYPVCMDALTGLLFPWQPLAQPRDIKKWEIHQVPTYIATPKIEQIEFLSLKRLVAETQRDLPPLTTKRELVDLLAIEKLWTAYRRMRILQYVREGDGAILVQVFDRGDRSPEHEAALINMENKQLRPLRAVIQSQVPEINPEDFRVIDSKKLDAARQIAIESPKIKQEIEVKTQILEQAKSLQSSELVQDRREATFQVEQLNEQITMLESRLKEMESQAGTTEVLQMYEHRPKLIEALRTAKNQVLIVSPWLNTDAIDYELRLEIGKALQKGVDILIAYGFSEESRAEKESVKRLKETADKKKGKLKLHRIGDLHSKVLICDEKFMVLTSFNWLSFAGDPTRGTRYEDGMLTRDKNAIAEKIKEWTDRISGVSPK